MATTLIRGFGVNDEIKMQVDSIHKASRVSLRPPDPGAYGSYRKSLKSGVIAAGLAGPLPVWEFRWGRSDVVAIIRALRIQAVVSTTAMAATAADSSFSLFRVSSFSALDTTGATLGAFTINKTGALSTRFPPSQFAGDATALKTGNGGIAILNTAATGLTGGTRTNDTDPIAIVMNRIAATAAAETIITPEPAPYLIDPSITTGLQPMEFYGSEGLVLMADAITATGTWRLMVDCQWDEFDSSRYFS